ncbi:hypothetical protein AAG570_000515 [Ranatra chinensis]|uniref:ZAD domain-containing protein n=1 Tax=Ranatra chinensis TaxID=642074 RepID=A0ABD0YXA3_9HEMI
MAANPFCRLCALKSDNYVDVFNEEGQKLSLCSKIKQCLQIWLFPEDVLPKTICTDCCRKVEDFSNFFSSCSQAQVSLMEILNGNPAIDGNNVESLEVKLLKASTANTSVCVCGSVNYGAAFYRGKVDFFLFYLFLGCR